jgi:DNA invertase Pin-like site-specific DNA recombinase
MALTMENFAYSRKRHRHSHDRRITYTTQVSPLDTSQYMSHYEALEALRTAHNVRKEKMALVGYAWVSSVGQRLDTQLDKLKHCDNIFQDQQSCASGQRPGWRACLNALRPGDTLVVTHLDRLACSILNLYQIADDLERKDVGLQVLDQHLDTRDGAGRQLFLMLGAIAQFETQIRIERQREGILQAQARGVHLGRKKRLAPEQASELRKRRAQGDLIKTLMQDYGLSKASVYRYLVTHDASLDEKRPAVTLGHTLAPQARKTPSVSQT